MLKHIEVKPFLSTGEKAITRIQHRSKTTRKIASSIETEATRYAKSIQKEDPSNEVLVVIALTLYEIFGSNDNGDGFVSELIRGFKEEDLIQNNFESFNTGASVYYQHDSDAKPLGKVHKAFLNKERGWVELVIEVFGKEAPEDVMDRIRNDEMPNVSMGCDVKYDVCNICFNKAKTVADHCHHIKNNLHEIIDGKAVSMLCPSPKFFDISFVTIGADSLAVGFFRKAAQLSSSGKPHDYSNKIAEILFNKESKQNFSGIYKMSEIYKGISDGNIYVDEKLKEIFEDGKEKINSTEPKTIFDEIIFFSHLGLPYPLKKIADKSGKDFSELLEKQEKIVEELKSNPEYREKFKKLVQEVMSVKPKVNEQAFKNMMPDYKGSLKSVENFSFSDEFLPIFNIINKFYILNKNNYLKSKLAGKNIANTEMEDVILTEYLIY